MEPGIGSIILQVLLAIVSSVTAIMIAFITKKQARESKVRADNAVKLDTLVVNSNGKMEAALTKAADKAAKVAELTNHPDDHEEALIAKSALAVFQANKP